MSFFDVRPGSFNSVDPALIKWLEPYLCTSLLTDVIACLRSLVAASFDPSLSAVSPSKLGETRLRLGFSSVCR